MVKRNNMHYPNISTEVKNNETYQKLKNPYIEDCLTLLKFAQQKINKVGSVQ
jgi:hypothetical protein